MVVHTGNVVTSKPRAPTLPPTLLCHTCSQLCWLARAPALLRHLSVLAPAATHASRLFWLSTVPLPTDWTCVVPRGVLFLLLRAVLCRAVLSHWQNDFTPEQEEEVRRENQWAFD